MDPAIVLFGLGVGILVGATGMGGGSLMTPLLILVFGIKPVVAVGSDLAYAAVTKSVGGYRHLVKGKVHRRMAFWLAVGSCPGALIAVGLIVGFRLSPHLVVGTDVVHAAVLLWVAALAHLVSGNIDCVLTGTILIGSIPGVWIGTNVSTKLPADALRPALAIVLIASGLALLSKAGLAMPAAVLIGVPIALAIVTFLLYRARKPVGVSR